jgi:lysophospholipase L1-like esterase
MRRRSFGLLTVVLSALWGLLLLEVAVRADYAIRGKSAPHRERAREREWRWAAQHLDMEQPVLLSGYRFDPDVGWAMQPNLKEESFRTNSAGMRSARDFSEEPVPGHRRILFVGDSYTFGANVRDEETFQAVLERDHLPSWDVINMGVSGYGPDQALLLYEKIGTRYRPDIVVLGFFDRGFFRLFSDFRSYAKPHFALNGNEGLELEGVPVVSPEELYGLYASGQRRIGGWHHSYLANILLGNLYRELQDRHVSRDDDSWELMARILRRFRDRATEERSQPFLLILPARPRECDGCVYEQLAKLAEEEARALDVPVLSLRPEFLKYPDDSLYQNGGGGHLNARGNELVARLLAGEIRRIGLTD